MICPRCGREFSEPPALSRADNKTLICSRCGSEEALIAARIKPEVREQLLEKMYPKDSSIRDGDER